MGNRKTKKPKKQIVKNEYNNMLQDQMIEIHAEAYYRTLKRIEQEKIQTQERKKDRWYIELLFILNIIFWPWKISKRFGINKRLYDSLLVLFVAGVLHLVGFLLWSFGILAIIYEIYKIVKNGISSAAVTAFSIELFMLVLGSTFTLAGSEFYKETDSSKIYAFSACIIALISCVVAIITLIKM